MRIALAATTALIALAAAAPAALGQPQPIPIAPVVIDGPSAPGAGPTALTSSIARDGTGGLVYLKPVGGVTHVFLSTIAGGAFQPPVQIDVGLAGGSSQPLVAAGSGGALVVAFLNGSGLYVAQRRNAMTRLGAPRLLAAGAGNPALATSAFGKTYLAYTVPDGAGFDVRAAFEGAGGWSLVGTPLNLTRGDDAGTGAGRPAAAAAGDGVGIVAWGEHGHIYTRRVWGTSPSAVTEQADAPLPYCSETAADEPAIGTGGDSSFAAVAFHETLSCNGVSESRTLVNRLHGSRYDGVAAADGAFGTPPGATDHPATAVGEYGSGWVTSETAGDNIAATSLGSNETAGPLVQVNSLPDATRPFVTPAMAGLYSAIIAWQHDPGADAAPDIRARYADSAHNFGGEFVLSQAAEGPTDAAAGLTAGGDLAGDAAVAWVQSTPAGDELIADELLHSPGAPTPTAQPGFLRTTRPALGWTAAFEPWGALRYSVSVDGQPLGQTSATSIGVPAPLAQGRHTWQVLATNQVGLSSGAETGTFFIDTLAPVLTIRLGHNRIVGRVLRIGVAATDHPPPLTPGQASGVASIVVRWGDGTVERIAHARTHVYRRRGRYRITVIALDHAGNATVQTIVVRILAPPKPKPKRTHKPTGSGPSGSSGGTHA